MAENVGAVVTGLDEVLRNLNEEVTQIEGDTRSGLISAARFIKLEAMSRAPEDTGNLKDTAFNKIGDSRTGPFETIGFTALYAPAVHESKEKLKGEPRAHFGRTREGVEFGGGSGTGHYWDKGESHFLEKALLENFGLILRKIKGIVGREGGS